MNSLANLKLSHIFPEMGAKGERFGGDPAQTAAPNAVLPQQGRVRPHVLLHLS